MKSQSTNREKGQNNVLTLIVKRLSTQRANATTEEGQHVATRCRYEKSIIFNFVDDGRGECFGLGLRL